MKALIVDGEDLYRLSLREVVALSGTFTEVVDAGSEHDFLTKTANLETLDLVILHPETLANDGQNCLKLVRRLYPNAPIILIAGQDSAAQVIRSQAHPASVTLQVGRQVRIPKLVELIRQALQLPHDSRLQLASQSLRANLSNEFAALEQSETVSDKAAVRTKENLTRLSARQRQILAMAADGLPNKAIAENLVIAEGTVKAHMHAIFKVMEVSNRTQAVIRYRQISQGSAAVSPLFPNKHASNNIGIRPRTGTDG